LIIATNKNDHLYDILECEENIVTAAHSDLGVVRLGALVIEK